MQNSYLPKLARLALIFVLCLTISVQMAQAKASETSSLSSLTLTVNSTVDAVDAHPGDGVCATATGECTLRAAIQETNAQPGADALVLPAGVYTLTIPGATEDACTTGDLDIIDDLSITGVSAENTIIDANGLERIFDILDENSHVVIENVTIRNGRLLVHHENGSAVYNRGNLLLRHTVVTDNGIGDFDAGGFDGALYNLSGTVQIEASVITANGNGAIANYDQVIIKDSRLADNAGNAILSTRKWNSGIAPHVLISNSRFEHNGSGIVSLAGTLLVQDSKFANNTDFAISSSDTAEIKASTIISNGRGIVSEYNLTITESVIQQNRGIGVATRYGRVQIQDSAVLSNTNGGINLQESLWLATIANTTIQGNQAKWGGGIYNNAHLILDHVSLRANNAVRAGGGIFNSGRLFLKDSTVSANAATDGGGLYNDGNVLTVDNSTFSGNTAVNGGGLFNNRGPTQGIEFYNATIADNTAAQIGGGVYLVTDTLHLQNSIIATNHSQTNQGNDCYTTQLLDAKGYNLIQDITNCPLGGINMGNLTGVDPKLGDLQDNGGKTWTHALLIDSPAIDAGNPNGCLDELNQPFLTDQRGYLRAVAGRGPQLTCDMGAVEFGDRSPNSAYMPQIFTSSSSAMLTKPATVTQVAETSGMLGLGLILGSALVASLGIIFLVDGEEEDKSAINGLS